MSTLKRKAKALGKTLRNIGAGSQQPPVFRHALEPGELRRGHSVRMIVDGPRVFDDMLAAIALAKRSVWLESYIFESGSTGTAFVEALAAKALEGVEVLVVIDAFGGLELSRDDELRLTSAGVQVRFFGRFNHLYLSRWLKRDHRKLLLVDGEQAYVGGINISDDYAARDTGGKGWHDIHACIRGPICDSLAILFYETWRQLGGVPALLPARSPEAPTGEWAMTLCSNHRGVRTRIRSHLVHALQQAENEVLLASAYFVPDRQLVRAMEGAARRGVFVGLLVPGQSDLASVQLAGEHSYDRLLDAGVHIYTWQGSHMHVKAAVVDRHWCHVGSYNLDYMSLLYSLELVVEIVGATSPRELAEVLRADMGASPELDWMTWRDRSSTEKLLSTVAYQFRRWL